MSSDTKMRTVTPIIPVNDQSRSREFYVHLGFEVRFEERGYVVMMRDDVEIHLSWVEGWHIDPNTNNTQIRIAVEGVEAMHELCQKLQVVHPNGPLEDKPWGTREFTVLDPDNACIAFYTDI